MAKLKIWLSGLLVVQLVAALGLYIGGQREGEFDSEQTLLSLVAADLDKVVIADNDNKAITLEKVDAAWQLPDYRQLPVNPDKFEQAMGKVVSAKSGWPVATSRSSHTRFEVGAENFQRKIELFKQSERVNTLYLGTSPGYRSVHARLDGDDNIYAIKLAAHEVPARHEDWFDKTVLRVGDVAGIKGADFELQKRDDKWELVQAAVVADDAPELDAARADEISSVFTNIRVQEVADDVAMDKAIEIRVSEGETTWTYEFASDDDGHYVRRNDRDIIFKVRDVDYTKIAEANLASLAADEEEEDSAEESVDLSQN